MHDEPLNPLDDPDTDPFEVAAAAAADIARLTGVDSHDIALTLGSGWGKAADLIGETTATVPATEITGFSKPALEGHVGTLRSILTADGRRVLVIGARTHFYEGHGVRRVVHSVRTAAATGEPSAYSLDLAALGVGAYRVGLAALDGDGVELALGDIGLTIGTSTAGEDDPAARPFALAAPAPNPASGVTSATLTLAQPVHVLAVVYDALGREALVAYDALAAGRVVVEVDTTALTTGVYVLRAVAVDGSAAQTRRFTVTR